jgi:hypothetical protein
MKHKHWLQYRKMFVSLILITDRELYYYLYALTPVSFFPVANSGDNTCTLITENHLQYHNFFKSCKDI